jgi:hypothetical protein
MHRVDLKRGSFTHLRRDEGQGPTCYGGHSAVPVGHQVRITCGVGSASWHD